MTEILSLAQKVAETKDNICFIEVKTRTDGAQQGTKTEY